MRILCIDPGPISSGYVMIDEKYKLLDCGIDENKDICLRHSICTDYLVIEMVASYGMPVGKTTFDTVVWIGRFYEFFKDTYKNTLITRKDVKKTISSGSAKDSNIRQALIDRYQPDGGGKIQQIGTKKRPGPLYGMKSHMWQALALGHAYLDGCKHYEL